MSTHSYLSMLISNPLKYYIISMIFFGLMCCKSVYYENNWTKIEK